MRAIFVQHDGGIGVGGTDPQVSDALIAATRHTTILRPSLLDPVMALFVVLGECLAFLLRERNRKGQRNWWLLVLTWLAASCFCWTGRLLLCCFLSKHVGEMGLDGKTWREGVEGGIGLDLGGIDIQLLPPDQACLLT